MSEKAPELLDDALREVLRAVDQAARLARHIQHQAPRSHEKHDKTPLTVADLAVQAVVASALERAFPDDPLVAEEDASTLRAEGGQPLAEQTLGFVQPLLPDLTRAGLVRLLDRGTGAPAERFWTLDPVDGTKGFLRGGHYVVALALIQENRPTVGMLGCPTLDRPGPERARGSDRNDERGLLMLAGRGHGTWISPMDAVRFRAVHVSDVRSLRDARMVRSVAESHIDVDATRALIQAAGIEHPPVLMDSQAKQATIAAGGADLLVRIPAQADYREYIWDHAAGALAIEEAQGHLTDLDGRPLDFSSGRQLERNRGIVASNGHLHPLVLDALRARGI